MQKNDNSNLVLSSLDKARPLTLKEVLRLRDGLEIPQGNIPGYPVQIVLPNFNRKRSMVLCSN
ncbi:MAG: hypothetical protein NPINA01_22760 [Nitrospinaceae bacterium]|nr:MAG: hypothetical protein NPINA01_22760 [Nitrospinaceae bacterium]